MVLSHIYLRLGEEAKEGSGTVLRILPEFGDCPRTLLPLTCLKMFTNFEHFTSPATEWFRLGFAFIKVTDNPWTGVCDGRV